MTKILFTLSLLLFILIAVVSRSIEECEKGHFRPRAIMVVTGLLLMAGGAALLYGNISDPAAYFSLGFFIGPILLLGALFAIVVSLFFPTSVVRSVLRHFFDIKMKIF